MTGLPLRAVILDFDGVILESNDLKTEGFARVFSAFPEHATAMMAFHHANVSMSRFGKFEHLATVHLGRPAGNPLIGDLGRRFSEVMMQLIENCPMVPGAEAFLRRVSARVPLFLASMTPQTELETIIARRALTTMFAGIFGCPPSPKVDVIRTVIEQYGGMGDRVLFVGDSAGDQRAAAETGVEFLARNSGLIFDDPQPRSFPDMTALFAAIEDRLP